MKHNRRKLNITLLIIAFLFTVFAIAKGAYINERETVRVGMVSSKRYVAPRDIEDKNATDRLREEARNSVGDLYKHDDAVERTALENINTFFDELDASFDKNEEGGTVYVTPPKDKLNIPVALTSEQYYAYYSLSSVEREKLRDSVYDTAEYVFQQGITDETMAKALELARDELNDYNYSDNIYLLADGVLSAVLTPNLVLDTEAIEAARDYKEAQVEPVMILSGQKIVDEGEVITQDIYDVLEDLNLINVDYSAGIVPIAGAIGVTAVIFITAAIYFVSQQGELIKKTSRMLIIFTAYIISILLVFIAADFSEYYFVPLYIFPILVSIMVGAKTAVILNLFLCVCSTFIFNGSVDFILYFISVGSFLAFIVRYTRRRSYIILVAAAAGAVGFGSYIAVKLFVAGGYNAALLRAAIYAAATVVVTVMLAIGSLPVWEAVFKIDTPYKLLEFTNPNNEILKRLMIEAPGTYHHSLIVANLAETAAYDISADGTLARAGAYYHDIGKLHNPQCFAENQNGKNIHDHLPPDESAELIKEHVFYGMELAKKYKLPKVIRDFICQHHGTSLIKFFYYKEAKENSEADEEFYRYPGPIPQNKETAIVMLADTAEAAVRSIISSGKGDKEVAEFIDKLIKDKLDDGQLNDCGLNLKELRRIRESFMNVFNGMYHDRIIYPDEDELKRIRKK